MEKREAAGRHFLFPLPPKRQLKLMIEVGSQSIAVYSRFDRYLFSLPNTTRQLTPSKREPQVGRGLSGVRLLILHFKFQFSKSIISSTFHIFLNLTYPLRKNISFPKCPKTTQKFTQYRKTLVYVLNRGIWHCLKRARDIGTKAMLSDVKTAFR